MTLEQDEDDLQSQKDGQKWVCLDKIEFLKYFFLQKVLDINLKKIQKILDFNFRQDQHHYIQKRLKFLNLFSFNRVNIII